LPPQSLPLLQSATTTMIAAASAATGTLIPTPLAMSVWERLKRNKINLTPVDVQHVLRAAAHARDGGGDGDAGTDTVLSPVASFAPPQSAPTHDVRYLLPDAETDDDDAPRHHPRPRNCLLVAFPQPATRHYVVHVEAGSRLRRHHAAALLARILGEHGFEFLLCLQFREVLNINACVAMGILGFFLSRVETAAKRDAHGNVQYRAYFNPVFPAAAKKRQQPLVPPLGALALPPWDPRDLQFQTVLHSGAFFTSYLDLRTRQFRWKRNGRQVHATVLAHLPKVRGNLQALNREYLDELQAFFVRNARALDQFWAVGAYPLGGTECWFLGTMQDVFDKQELLRRQPGAPVHLLGAIRLCFFAKKQAGKQ
jgi:hypothetical protein